MHLSDIEGHTNRHPITRHQRRACREQARIEAGFIALHRRPAPPIIPVAPSHRQERAATRRSLAVYSRRELTAAAA